MKFESRLAREMQDVRKDAALKQIREEAGLLPVIAAWQTEIENAIAAHANVQELETAQMGG